MGKPGKKAGKGMLPPTKVQRQVPTTQTHLRDSRTIKRLKMYTSKIKRDEKGNIVEGSVLSASDRVEKTMARIAPDRRWFGNTRVIGQEALQKFREELGAKYRDPYSVVIKQSKLPLSLLEEPKKKTATARREMQFERTFGKKSQRRRVQLATNSLEEVVKQAVEHQSKYAEGAKDTALVRPRGDVVDINSTRSILKKGQSMRIWNELFKVIDSADVVLYVLDARDPLGTRSTFIEEHMRKAKKHKHFVFILNKCDLIPLWATARWLQILSKEAPTIAFHASVEHPFGKGNLISLLRQFSRLHNVTHRGSKRTKTPISIGVIGYPNVGKSALINTLKRKTVCRVAPIPGETKVWQYVMLTRSIFMIDCPGVIYEKEGNDEVEAVLKGVVRIERLGDADKTNVVQKVLDTVQRKDIDATYGKIGPWTDAISFLEALAKHRGKLLPGGGPDSDIVARSVLYDWQRGKIPWYRAPPYESNHKLAEAMAQPQGELLKLIEQQNTFSIVNDRIERVGELEHSEPTEAAQNGDAEGTKDAEEMDSADVPKGRKIKSKAKRVSEAGKGVGLARKRRKAESGSDANASSIGPTVATALQEREEQANREERRKRRSSKAGKVEPTPAAARDAEDAVWARFVSAAA